MKMFFLNSEEFAIKQLRKKPLVTHGKRKKHISVRIKYFSSFELHGFVETF